MNPWKDLRSDVRKEFSGVWHDLPDTDWRFRIARLCDWSTGYFQAQSRLAKDLRFAETYERCVRNGETPGDDDRVLLHELEVRAFIEGCITDADFADAEGERVGHDLMKILDCFMQVPLVYQWCRNKAVDGGHYAPDPEAVEKN